MSVRRRPMVGGGCGVGHQAYDGAGCAPGEPVQPAHGPVPRRAAEPAATGRHHRAEPGQREQPDRRDDRRRPGRGGRPGRLGRRPAAGAAAGGARVRLRGGRRRRRDPGPGRAVRPGDVPARRGELPARGRPRPRARRPRRLLEGLAAVAAEAGVEVAEVLGYGVGVAGVVDQTGADAVVHSQTTGWDARAAGRAAAGRHRGAGVRGERRQDGRPGRDVVRRRPWRPARGDRDGRPGRRRGGGDGRAQLPRRAQQCGGVGTHHPGVRRRPVPLRRPGMPRGVHRRRTRSTGGSPRRSGREFDPTLLRRLLAGPIERPGRRGDRRDGRPPGRRASPA